MKLACVSLGLNPPSLIIGLSAVGASFGGFAGAFFAAAGLYQSRILLLYRIRHRPGHRGAGRDGSTRGDAGRHVR